MQNEVEIKGEGTLCEYIDFVNVKFKRLTPTARIPEYTRENDACLDIYSDQSVTIYPAQTVTVSTGIAMELPPQWEGRVRGRSGLSSRGIQVHHGTIDEEYRGEVGVVVHNTGPLPYKFCVGDRIAQLSVSPVYRIVTLEVKELSDTKRGSNGFGSSNYFTNPMTIKD